MSKEKIIKEIERLRDKIHRHDYRYYVLNEPKISDKEYDDLLKKLKKLEGQHPEFITPDSPSQRIGSDITNKFDVVNHRAKMYSLDNTYSFEELKEWDVRVRKGMGKKKIEYTCELKIDGLSANLTYEKGVFVVGATRGDGQKGENITNNIKTIRAIPLRLSGKAIPRLVEIRGEIYMNKSDFQKQNKQRKKDNQTLFANPRNAASGSMKLLESREVAKRRLNFFAHSLGAVENGIFDSQKKFLVAIKNWGMRVNPHLEVCSSIDEVIKICKKWEAQRESLDYESDGVVIKVNNIKSQKLLGHTLKSPRWAAAFKFAAQQATTVVQDIVAQVGRTGVITPVAQLKPIECAGVIIRNATLHNFEEIKRLDVHIGDQVVIERAGDVIPKVIKVTKSIRKGKEKKFIVPKKCPECNGQITKDKEEDVAYRCINSLCPAQLEKGLIHFACRSAMDIEGMGESVVSQLVGHKMIKDFSDIYTLKKKDLLKLELFKDKKANNLLKAIEESKKRPLSRLLFALGIRHVGEKAALVLAEKFGSLDRIMKSKKEDFEGIYEVGSVMAQSLEDFFNLKPTQIVIDKLEKLGLNMKEPRKDRRNVPFAGKTFVFTGELKDYSRKEAEGLVRSLGGNAASSVSKNTDFVVIGENPGSKYRKAKSLGVKIVDEKKLKEIAKTGRVENE